ncbi:MAG TPA: hypothetical protein VGM58_02150 [Verrucomicrobiae bacterium]
MTFRPPRLADKGYALIMVMIFLAATLLVLGSVMMWTESNDKEVKRNNLYFTSQAAAEAAVEQVVANMNRDYLQQGMNSSGTYQTNIPLQTGWPIQYTFSSAAGTNKTYVNLGATSTTLQPLGSQWSGLEGYPATNQVTSTATPKNQRYTVPATVTENVIYADIPLFQFAIFYNMNLEVQPGSGMNVGGPVFCNYSIWAASPMTFSNSVTAAGTINSNNISDPFMTAGSKSGSGNPTFMGGIATNHSELNLPIGTNNNPASVEAILKLPPSTYGLGTSGAYTTNGQIYFANQADLIITNTSTGGTNISVYWQDVSNSPTITKIPNNYFIISNKTSHAVSSTNTIAGLSSTTYSNLYWGYSFVTNVSLYDYREGKTVQAIQINVTNLGVWAASAAANGGSTINSTISTDKGHNIDSVYVYNNVPLSGTTLPAVSITNGAQLPSSSGLAVATPDPIYVMGNFNTQTNSAHSDTNLNSTTYTYPAALFGDALTVLSSNWKDSYTSATSLTASTGGGPRTPVATTVNAATLEGIVPSSGANYSGGAENFLRLLENWTSSIALTYNGSIVVMFPSQYATNIWQNTGNYYNAPKRQWAFDLNFTHQGGLPAMTPRVKGIIRQGWVP